LTALLPRDVEHLARIGIDRHEAERQIDLLRRGPRPRRLLRPCTPGDGIVVLSETQADRFEAAFRRATRRSLKLVPASGAASRMFSSLYAYLATVAASSARTKTAAAERENATPDVLRLARELRRFPFYEALDRRIRTAGASVETLLEEGKYATLLRFLLEPGAGLGLAELPKGLLPFHRYRGQVRTAFDEQLAEGAAYLGAPGLCRFHFTVSPSHELEFRAHAEVATRELESRLRARLEITFSRQSPATDTLALRSDGALLRTASGEIALRPGGHGALLENLERVATEIVFIKNIDNVLPEPRQGIVQRWKRILAGVLVELQDEVRALLAALDQGTPAAQALERAVPLIAAWIDPQEAERLRRLPLDAQAAALRQRLDRPLRVCGVVRNAGEPGGGPFWVASRGAVNRQIVESAEIDPTDAGQRAVFAAGTHFNPVDLACGLLDRRGRAYSLAGFADSDTVFISRKWEGGAELMALERPGLWNGGMEHWNTVFVEVPAETFAPAKTIFDLLRPEHQESDGVAG
jgi:hypothetical protein